MIEDGESLGDFIDPEEHAYTEAYRAISNIYTASPLDYEVFVEMLDNTFGGQKTETEIPDFRDYQI